MANYKNIRNANAEIERLRKRDQAQVRLYALSWAGGFMLGLLALLSPWLAIAIVAIGGLVWLFRANWTANISEARSVFDKRVGNGTNKIAGVGKRVREHVRAWSNEMLFVVAFTIVAAVIGGLFGPSMANSVRWLYVIRGAYIGFAFGIGIVLVQFIAESDDERSES